MDTHYFDQKYAFAKTVPKFLSSPWWIGHIPFSFSLIRALKPNILVELGTYTGTSFFSFCQAVDALGLNTKCYSVDLWEGDIHMGKFRPSLYDKTLAYKNEHYPNAIFIRKLFDDAVNDFSNNSIDLLHIDGTHTYEAVERDFNTWQPKLSNRGVVLFHDTNVNLNNIGKNAKNFGVNIFFNSIKANYPHIEFKHCYGLGVLIVGKKAPLEVLEMAEETNVNAFIEHFRYLGDKLLNEYQQNKPITVIITEILDKVLNKLLNMLGKFRHD